MILAGQSCRDFYRGMAKPGSGKFAARSVSRETLFQAPKAWFQVKKAAEEMNKERLLSYTKFSEDHIQDILDIDPTKQPTQRMNRSPQILRREFLAVPYHFHTALQRNRGFLQQFSLPLPPDQPPLIRAEIFLSERHQA